MAGRRIRHAPQVAEIIGHIRTARTGTSDTEPDTPDLGNGRYDGLGRTFSRVS